MDTMYIGSGDTAALLSGKNTETHYRLLRRFVSGERPYYNARRSPLDALRTGAILEDRYLATLPEDYYPQVEVICPEMDVLKCTLDFARMKEGKVIDFDELKTCNFNDFLSFEPFRKDNEGALAYIQKHYLNNYHQIQHQLYTTGLQMANLVYLAVYSYDDQENSTRVIRDNEYIKFRIQRDEKVIRRIRERATIFQSIKDYYTKP